MKTCTLLISFLLLLLSGCVTQEDDFISKYCPGSCTVIRGRFTTDDGTKPLAGVQLSVYWRSHQEYLQFGYTERRKAVATTDQDGKYELRFLLRDDELNTQSGFENGYMMVKAADETRYFTCATEPYLYKEYNLRRDTTVSLNYTLPPVAFVDIKPRNRQAIQTGDYLDVYFNMTSGRDNRQNCHTGYSFNASGGVHEAVRVAAMQPITVTAKKTKDGITTETSDTITLTPGQRFTYQPAF